MTSPIDNHRAFVDLQHRFRGLVARFRSRRFVENRRHFPQRTFRSGLQDLLLDARAAIEPPTYRAYLEWLADQTVTQLSELTSIPIGYDDLTGVYAKAPVVSLEHELLWITERIRIEMPRLSALIRATGLIQAAVFRGEYAEAIEGVDVVQTHLGVSHWSVQLRLALEHLAGGLERQKRYSADVRKILRGGLLNFTTYHSSVRNEDRTTLAKFLDDINARITGLTVHSDATKTYDRYRLKNELPTTDAGLAEVLRVEQSHGIVDIYETFVAVLQEIAKQGPTAERAELIVRCTDQIGLDDFRLVKLTALLAPARSIALAPRSTTLPDALLTGRVRHAMRLGRRLVSDDPWQHIYAGFALSHSAGKRASAPTRPTNIADLIARVHNRCDGSDDAWAQLAKLALNLRGLPLAAGLLEYLLQLRRSKPDQPWRPWLVGLNSPNMGAEDRPWELGCSAGPTTTTSLTDLVWYEASCPGNNASQVHRLIRAIGHIHRGDFELADETLGEATEDWPEALRNLRALARLHALHLLGDRQRVIDLVANEGSRSPTHARFLPVVSALSNFAWPDYKAVDHPLVAPIALHLLWTEQESSETASKMRFATGNALRGLEVARPSDLEGLSLPIPLHELVYFLRRVCVPDILDLSRLFSGTRAILEERQAICGLLTRLDPDNINDYQTEIVIIANELELDDGRWIVDSTRIHVDSVALIRWAKREIAEDYERYRDLVHIDDNDGQSFDDVLAELEAMPAQRSNFVPDNEADAVLYSILRRLAEEFLTNASFGLDFYLSKRVRHQSFIGLIRGPLEFPGLITTRETEAGEYHRNDAWVDKFDHVDDDARDAIDAALRSFAAKFDEIVLQAKDTYFHLRSADKPLGMITIDLNGRTVGLARTLIKFDFSFPEFVRVTVPMLWASIEDSLALIRNFITEEIKSRVINEFDFVRATVGNLAEQDSAWLEFDAAMGNAAAEVQLKLDEVAQWFVHADTLREHRLFSLEQILKIGVDTALKSQRGFSPQITQSAEGDLHLHAANLVFVHDVVFAGLGNARKHSGLKAPQIDVTTRWNVEEGTVTLAVTSDCRASLRAEKEKHAAVIRKIIAEGAHDRRTRVEEGSGFAKLAAVVKQSDRGRIDFGFTDDGRFCLNVTYAVIQTPGSTSDAA